MEFVSRLISDVWYLMLEYLIGSIDFDLRNGQFLFQKKIITVVVNNCQASVTFSFLIENRGCIFMSSEQKAHWVTCFALLSKFSIAS